MNLRKLLSKSERGQALAEYTVLIPPILLLTIMITIPLSTRMNYIFCRMLYAMDPSAGNCDQWLDQPVVEDETPLPDDDCVVFDQEEGASQCSQSDDCAELPGLNVGSYDASGDIESFVIKAGQDYHIYETGLTEDGCYYVEITGNHVSWELYGDEKICKDISNTQVWQVPLCQ